MRLIVSDSSYLIDLRKASLLEAFMGLPYKVLIPDSLFEEELVRFTIAEKASLLRGGLEVVELPGERVLRARAFACEHPRLSIHDCFAFALAESYGDCILLTGDAGLRTLAENYHLEVHGTLWVIDEIQAFDLSTTADLRLALQAFASDPSVRLPRRELAEQIRRYTTAG